MKCESVSVNECVVTDTAAPRQEMRTGSVQVMHSLTLSHTRWLHAQPANTVIKTKLLLNMKRRRKEERGR